MDARGFLQDKVGCNEAVMIISGPLLRREGERQALGGFLISWWKTFGVIIGIAKEMNWSQTLVKPMSGCVRVCWWFHLGGAVCSCFDDADAAQTCKAQRHQCPGGTSIHFGQ